MPESPELAEFKTSVSIVIILANVYSILISPDVSYCRQTAWPLKMLLNSGRPWETQSWNRCAYGLNNPLRFTDPSGLWEWDSSRCGSTQSQCDEYKEAFRKAYNKLLEARDNSKVATDRKRLQKVIDRMGTENDGGKVKVGFDDLLNYKGVELAGRALPNGKGGVSLVLNFSAIGDDVTDRAATLGHEGQHADHESGFFKAIGFAASYGLSEKKRTEWEAKGCLTESSIYKGLSVDDRRNSPPLWNNSWAQVDQQTQESRQTSAAHGNAAGEVKDLKKEQ